MSPSQFLKLSEVLCCELAGFQAWSLKEVSFFLLTGIFLTILFSPILLLLLAKKFFAVILKGLQETVEANVCVPSAMSNQECSILISQQRRQSPKDIK